MFQEVDKIISVFEMHNNNHFLHLFIGYIYFEHRFLKRV
jgi:hypothetical protein